MERSCSAAGPVTAQRGGPAGIAASGPPYRLGRRLRVAESAWHGSENTFAGD